MSSHFNWLTKEVTIDCREVTPESVSHALDVAREITDRGLAGGRTEISGSAQKVSVAFPILPIRGAEAVEMMEAIDDVIIAARFGES